jgi:hypothetical protein
MPAPLPTRRILIAAATLGVACAAAFPLPALAQPEAEARPFARGEELRYRVSIRPLGRGSGSLRVDRAEPIRGEPVEQLEFAFHAKVGLFSVRHLSRSWLSSGRWAALRYEIHERSPLGKVEEEVELFPSEQRWKGLRAAGESATTRPLDELSYLYLLRTLPLSPGESYQLDRHYDPRRNPAVVRVLAREAITVPAGTFETIAVEFEVRDPSRCKGRAVLRLHLSDDARRLPVRIASSCPAEMVLELQSLTPGSSTSQENAR